MKTRAQILGHPIHPMLIVFPTALLPLALLFDIVYLIRGEALWWTMAFWTLLAGLAGGLAAAVPGLVDYTTIPRGTPGRRVATRHLVSGLFLIALAAASTLLRGWGAAPPPVPALLPVGLLAAANLLAILQGYWGGELVYHHGVGVAPGASPETPPGRSLAASTGEPRGPRPGGGTE